MMPRKKPTTEENTDSSVAVAVPPMEQSSERSEVSFFERLSQYNEDEWRGLKLYVYRLWPVIDKKDSEQFLSKISQPCDEDFILSTFGSGKYYLRLNNSKGKTVASSTVSVYNQDRAPRVNPEEVVVSDPLNERYFKTWGKKEDQPKANVENGGNVLDFAKAAMQTAAQGNRGPALDPEVFNLFKEATKERDSLAKQLSEIVRQHFPNARIVADRFHVIRLINQHFLACWREIDPVGAKNRGLMSLMRRHRHNLKPEQQIRPAQYFAVAVDPERPVVGVEPVSGSTAGRLVALTGIEPVFKP
jgi:hypothetical protein